MKKLLIVVAATLSLVGFADDVAKPSLRRRPSRPSGGLLERKEAVPSKNIVVSNKQSVLGQQDISGIVDAVRVVGRLPFRLEGERAGMTIDLVEADDMGMLAIFPDDFYAKINVKALAKDGAAKDVVRDRVKKQIVRAGFLLLGSGYSQYPGLMRPISSVAELDSCPLATPSPDNFVHLYAATKVGVKDVRFASYRDACREGWAPEPKDDIQKAIWAEYHAKPTEPMKIEFDPKKGE